MYIPHGEVYRIEVFLEVKREMKGVQAFHRKQEVEMKQDRTRPGFGQVKLVNQPIERLGPYGFYREGGIELPKTDGCIASQNRPSQQQNKITMPP